MLRSAHHFIDPAPDGLGPAADGTIDQNWKAIPDAGHGVWDWLFDRQRKLMADCAIAAFNAGLEALRLSRPGIPDVREVNRRLQKVSGWTIVPAPGRLPETLFYAHLSQRRFPAVNTIRDKAEIDSLAEPDLFHDLFGHVPLLAHPAFAEVMQEVGLLGLQAVQAGKLDLMARLYRHLVEFGLAREDGELRLFGASLASSRPAALFALKSFEPVREPFSVEGVLETPCGPDMFQPHYFVVDDFAALLGTLKRVRWC